MEEHLDTRQAMSNFMPSDNSKYSKNIAKQVYAPTRTEFTDTAGNLKRNEYHSRKKIKLGLHSIARIKKTNRKRKNIQLIVNRISKLGSTKKIGEYLGLESELILKLEEEDEEDHHMELIDLSEEQLMSSLQSFCKSTPLHNASKCSAAEYHEKSKIIERLVKVCPNLLGVRDGEGCTPLHHACISGFELSIVQLFLDANPRTISMIDNKGRLPLHNAYMCSPLNLEVIVELCLLYPKAAKIQDNFGRIPSDYGLAQ